MQNIFHNSCQCCGKFPHKIFNSLRCMEDQCSNFGREYTKEQWTRASEYAHSVEVGRDAARDMIRDLTFLFEQKDVILQDALVEIEKMKLAVKGWDE